MSKDFDISTNIELVQYGGRYRILLTLCLTLFIDVSHRLKAISAIEKRMENSFINEEFWGNLVDVLIGATQDGNHLVPDFGTLLYFEGVDRAIHNFG